jgi:hypothetical protein
MKNADFNADLKSGEKVENMFTPKMLYPTNFMIRSENGKLANFLQFFVNNIFWQFF